MAYRVYAFMFAAGALVLSAFSLWAVFDWYASFGYWTVRPVIPAIVFCLVFCATAYAFLLDSEDEPSDEEEKA